MLRLLSHPTQIVSVNTSGNNFKRGADLKEIHPIYDHSVVIEKNLIKDIIPNHSINKFHFEKIISLSGKVLLPGLVECHTHTAFAGSRANEFKQRLDGMSYEEISKSGGGINSTVAAVRKCSFDDLTKIIFPRINYFISQGVTTLEIKSGYGLSFYDEIKLLQVINYLNEKSPINIIPTFLGAHTYPKEYKNDHKKYLDIIINRMLPYISENNLASFCDGFCEKTAFSSDEIDNIFQSAARLGLKLRLHSEQFNNIGGLETALKHKAVSVDHLEVLREEQINLLANSETVAVLLPGVSFFLDYNYAPARKLINSNTIVALATDYNPGSSNISSLNLIMSLAAINMGMTIEESISAVTINAAKALALNHEIGSIELNKNADFSVFDADHYTEIVYQVAKNLNVLTIKNGQVIYDRNNQCVI